MGKTSKYRVVMDWVHRQIKTGALHAGDKLETEAQMSTRFGFSRQTIRLALGALEKEGTISRVQGSGSYVRSSAQPGTQPPLSQCVTIITSCTDSHIFPGILHSMTRVLQSEGYSFRIEFTNNRRQAERESLTELLKSGGRDPVIAEPVTSALPNLNAPLYRKLRERGIPVIFFNSWYPELNIPHVSLDDRAAGRMVTEYLISLGHRRIGCLMKHDDGQGILRYSGYQDALEAARIPLDESIVCWVDSTSLKQALYGCEWILKRLQDCTGVVCYNDEAAFLLTQQCFRQKILIPEQLSLVSIDDSRLTGLNQVPLTSASHHPLGKLGEKTARNLLELIRDPGFDATYEFKPRLTVRESTAKV